MGELNWNGDGFMEWVGERYGQRLDVAAEAVAQRMRDLVSEPFPPASKPGDPPHKRTGTLQQSIHWTAPSPLVRQIGSSAPYALYLEFGTGERATDIKRTGQYRPGFRQNAGMYRRPFVLRSLVECMGEIRQIVIEGELSAVA